MDCMLYLLVGHLGYDPLEMLSCFGLWFLCSFEFRLRVTLGPAGDLMLTSRIRNTNPDGKPFTFTFAYHTYFSVSDIR